jgi:hypothetical protein
LCCFSNTDCKSFLIKKKKKTLGKVEQIVLGHLDLSLPFLVELGVFGAVGACYSFLNITETQRSMPLSLNRCFLVIIKLINIIVNPQQ